MICNLFLEDDVNLTKIDPLFPGIGAKNVQLSQSTYSLRTVTQINHVNLFCQMRVVEVNRVVSNR